MATVVVLSDVPYECQEADIHRALLMYGIAVDIQMHKQRGQAVVTMRTAQEAHALLSRRSVSVLGSTVRVSSAAAPVSAGAAASQQQQQQQAPSSAQRPPHGVPAPPPHYTVPPHAPPRQQQQQQPHHNAQGAAVRPSNRLHVVVEDCRYPITRDVLMQMFSMIAPPVHVHCGPSGPTTVGSVEYADVAAAERAMQQFNHNAVYPNCCYVTLTYEPAPLPPPLPPPQPPQQRQQAPLLDDYAPHASNDGAPARAPLYSDGDSGSHVSGDGGYVPPAPHYTQPAPMYHHHHHQHYHHAQQQQQHHGASNTPYYHAPPQMMQQPPPPPPPQLQPSDEVLPTDMYGMPYAPLPPLPPYAPPPPSQQHAVGAAPYYGEAPYMPTDAHGMSAPPLPPPLPLVGHDVASRGRGAHYRARGGGVLPSMVPQSFCPYDSQHAGAASAMPYGYAAPGTPYAPTAMDAGYGMTASSSSSAAAAAPTTCATQARPQLPPAAQDATVLVGNVTETVPLYDVWVLLEVYGNVNALRRQYRDRSKVVAQFQHAVDARAAVMYLHGCPFYGHTLSLKFVPGYVERGVHVEWNAGPSTSPSTLAVLFTSGYHHRTRPTALFNPLGRIRPDRNLYVANLNESISDAELKAAFVQHGCDVVAYRRKTPTVAIVAFADIPTAIRALIAMHARQMHERYLRITFSRYAPLVRRDDADSSNSNKMKEKDEDTASNSNDHTKDEREHDDDDDDDVQTTPQQQHDEQSVDNNNNNNNNDDDSVAAAAAATAQADDTSYAEDIATPHDNVDGTTAETAVAADVTADDTAVATATTAAPTTTQEQRASAVSGDERAE